MLIRCFTFVCFRSCSALFGFSLSFPFGVKHEALVPDDEGHEVVVLGEEDEEEEEQLAGETLYKYILLKYYLQN